MSRSWYIYSPKSSKELLVIEHGLDAALERFDESHPDADSDESPPSCVVGGQASPSIAVVEQAYRERRETLDPRVKSRLLACKSTLCFDEVRGGLESPIQTSVLLFALEQVGEAVMDWGDLSLELSESALAMARQSTRHADFGPPQRTPPPLPSVGTAARPRPLDVLPSQLEILLEAMAEDRVLLLDVQKQLQDAAPLVVAYMRLLMTQGPVTSAKAAEELHSDADAVEGVLAYLATRLAEFLPALGSSR
jgi:hypothetical protein